MAWIVGVLALVAACGLAAHGFASWAARWGATAEEHTAAMPGDGYLRGVRAIVVMTRAVTISVSPEYVWPWLAQLGRGAGWYSYDRLDNGARTSARHIVSWIPPPALGDASAIGYVRHLEPGRAITWWTSGVDFLGSRARLVTDIRLTSEGSSSRLIIRMSADAEGGIPSLALWVFQFIDGVMARRQILGIRERAELSGQVVSIRRREESGERDQYQHYEVVYASGHRAGTPGVEHADRWRQAAIDAGLVGDSPIPEGSGG